MKEIIEKINAVLNNFEEVEPCQIDDVMNDINHIFASGEYIENADLEVITTFISQVNGTK